MLKNITITTQTIDKLSQKPIDSPLTIFLSWSSQTKADPQAF
jgi:hypothetical protein